MSKEQMRRIARERRPFVRQYGFILNAFQRRYLDDLLTTRRDHTWQVVGADAGSGLSLGLTDLASRLNGRKDAQGRTSVPLLWAIPPYKQKTERAFCASLAARFGTVPHMTPEIRRTWLIRQGIRCGVDTIVIDNAQRLEETHIMYLIEFADTVEIETGGRRIAVIFLCSTIDGVQTLKDKFNMAGTHWTQVRERLDPSAPYIYVAGHTPTELEDICAGFEEMYRDQLPQLNLVDNAQALFDLLSTSAFDVDAARRAAMGEMAAKRVGDITKRVAMRHVSNVLHTALETSYYLGHDDVDAATLKATVDVYSKGPEIIQLLDTEPTRIDPLVISVDGEPANLDPIVFGRNGGHMDGDGQWPDGQNEVAG